MNKDLKTIKDHFGENFAKLCRGLFSTLLETEGLLPKLLMDHFGDNHLLYEDILNDNSVDEFKNYIYSFIDVEKETAEINKTPKELLDEAGYYLYECKTEEEIQTFKKYYKKEEELCTFRGGRLFSCYVFFAVKKDVDNIKRENFSNPKREDEYGTSVISVQFYRGKNNNVSIKNRYNHTVNNPDATYSNNLDNIIIGLTSSFKKEYGLKIGEMDATNFDLPDYIKANDGKYYKFNHEINNIYYCPNNIIIKNGDPIMMDKSRYIMIDYFILDLQEKKIIVPENIRDAFADGLNDISKIDIRKNGDYKSITIKPNSGKDIIITIDKTNRIIEYENENIKKVGHGFLRYNITLQQLKTPNLIMLGNDFMINNQSLQQLNAPNLQTVGDHFLYYNELIQEINVPNLIEVGHNFMIKNQSLQQLNAPNLQTVGDNFLYYNEFIQEINVPNLKVAGNYFLGYNLTLKYLNVPNLIMVGDGFLYCNECLEQLNAPHLKSREKGFLESNDQFRDLDRRR